LITYVESEAVLPDRDIALGDPDNVPGLEQDSGLIPDGEVDGACLVCNLARSDFVLVFGHIWPS